MTLHRGSREIQIRFLGRAHTDGDIVNQANGTLIAQQMGQNARISGTIQFNGVRNGTQDLRIARFQAGDRRVPRGGAARAREAAEPEVIDARGGVQAGLRGEPGQARVGEPR